MKRYRIKVISLVLGLFLLSGIGVLLAQGNQKSVGTEVFLRGAAANGLFEIEMGRIAAGRAASQAVRAFALRLVTDQERIQAEISALAAQKGISLPGELGTKERETLKWLAVLSGVELDRDYTSLAMDGRRDYLREFKREAGSGQDEAVRAFAAAAIPLWQEHWKEAGRILAALPKPVLK